MVDPYHRLYGHPGISVVDGSTISANLGVNPSLTITAQAERAMALWPNLGDPDPRPSQDALLAPPVPSGEPPESDAGTAYRRLDPVPPRDPAVPPHAFAALRW